MVLVFSHCLIMIYVCTKFHEKILYHFKVIERLNFQIKNQKGIMPQKLKVEFQFLFLHML